MKFITLITKKLLYRPKFQVATIVTSLPNQHASGWKGEGGWRRSDTPDPKQEIVKLEKMAKLERKERKSLERETFPGEFAVDYPPKGKIFDKKPFRLELQEGKTYAWCTCGQSKSQPFCDGTHKKIIETRFVKTQPIFAPFRFTVDKTKDYYLCNCKQTNNRPYCDGTHRREDIQEKIRD